MNWGSDFNMARRRNGLKERDHIRGGIGKCPTRASFTRKSNKRLVVPGMTTCIMSGGGKRKLTRKKRVMEGGKEQGGKYATEL